MSADCDYAGLSHPDLQRDGHGGASRCVFDSAVYPHVGDYDGVCGVYVAFVICVSGFWVSSVD